MPAMLDPSWPAPPVKVGVAGPVVDAPATVVPAGAVLKVVALVTAVAVAVAVEPP